jgi:predicted AAA+ superfamily ATPase
MARIISAQNIDVINQGSLAEIFTGIEIVKNSPSDQKPQLYYWHKEKRGSNAEVDYILQKGSEILPVEVKSGIKGKMQGMRIFMDEHKSTSGIRISLENFSRFGKIEIYPLYAIRNVLYLSPMEV